MFFASSQEANCGRRAASLSRWQRRRREAPWYQIFLECVTVSGRPRGRTLGLHRKHMWVEHRVRESRYKGATEPRHLHTRCSTVTCNRVVNYRRKSQQSTVQPLPHHGYQRQHSSSHHPLGFRAGWWVPFNLFTFVFIFFWLHGIGMVSVGRLGSLQHFHLSMIKTRFSDLSRAHACHVLCGFAALCTLTSARARLQHRLRAHRSSRVLTRKGQHMQGLIYHARFISERIFTTAKYWHKLWNCA